MASPLGAHPPHPVSSAPLLRRKSSLFPWAAGAFLSLTFGLGFLILLASLGSASKPAVGIVELSGAITDEGARGVLGGGATSGARKFIADLEAAQDDPTVKAIVIRINSPGGSASASQEMFGAVRRARITKPVVASMGDVAASGGYYVAAACDKIYANGSTLTGSIGVISQFVNYGELFRKLGLSETTVKTGAFKDSGNPTRALRPEEKTLFQVMIGDVYNQFLTDVLAGRKTPTQGKLTLARLRALADGRVYTGRQAKVNLLVDENGGLHDAIQYAAKKVNLGSKPNVRNFSQSSGFGSLFGVSTESLGKDLGESFARGAVNAATQTGLPRIQ